MIEKSAHFSPDRTYRYTLSRIWIPERPYVCFVGLNPSTADETRNDPTVSRCIRYAERWGFGGMYMMNLFAYRSTDPAKLYECDEPIGLENDHYLNIISAAAGITVAAWGFHGTYMDRGAQVIKLLKSPHYLALTKGRQPRHPLYLKSSLEPIPFTNTERAVI
jgi:hypothetical protein